MQNVKENRMISVGCPNCGKLYQIPETALGDKGRTMKCKACGEKWFCTTEHIQNPFENETPVINTPKQPSIQANDPWDASPTEQPITQTVNSTEQAVALTRTDSEMENPFEVSGISSVAREKVAQKSFKKRKFDDAASQNEDIDSEAELLLAAERAKRKQNIKHILLKPNIMAGIATFIIAFVFLVFPSLFVGLNTSYANFYTSLGYTINTQGLAIDNVMSRLESDKAGTYLKVEGDITNITQESKVVPRIKLFIKNKTGTEIYTWVISPTKAILLSGETVRFKTNYAEPSLEAAQLEVKFLTGTSIKK